LSEAENLAYESHRRAQREKSKSQTTIYSPGTEYLLCQAQVQIMSAVVGVLTENITESMKAFYKLRKAYITLDAILAEEKKYLDSLEAESGERLRLETEPTPTDSSFPSEVHSRADSRANGNIDGAYNNYGSDGEEFYDAPEDTEQLEILETLGPERVVDASEKTPINDNTEKVDPLRRLSSQIQEGPDADIFTNHVDAFIHSSSNMCYGMLLIMISMLPPAFSTLSRIVGFKGDRKRGIALLWQASKFGNLNGAFAGLVLMGYYNGFIGFCDILPLSGSGAYPKERCKVLLQTFRQRFSKVTKNSKLVSSRLTLHRVVFGCSKKLVWSQQRKILRVLLT
jgi:Protein of unknown function (DUF3808)